MKTFAIPFTLLILLPFAELAEARQWRSYSVSLLHGENYRVSSPKANIVTLEYVAGYNWGDAFAFADIAHFDDGENTLYTEFSSRFDIKSFDNNSWFDGLWFDGLKLAGTVEHGHSDANQFTNLLLGLGTNLKLPYTDFFQINGYQRINENQPNNWQLTFVFARSFTIGSAPLLFDGFMDYETGTSDEHPMMNLTTQLKWDIGCSLFQMKRKQFYAGVEYVYWNNKYGIKSSSGFITNERNANLLLKFHY